LPRRESDPTFSAAFGSSQSFDKEFNFDSFVNTNSNIVEEPLKSQAEEEK